MYYVNIDFETRSTTELKTAGVYKYVEDPNTDVWCMAYAIGDDDDVKLWVPGDEFPVDIASAIANDGALVRAWNAQFERVVWNSVMVQKHGWFPLERENFICTMAEAMAMGLPASLGQSAEVCRLPVEKDMAGNRLAIQMSKPRSKKGQPLRWWNTPDRLTKLYDYCKQDVRTERAMEEAVRCLSPAERDLYLLDQKINDRGMCLDRELVAAAKQYALIGTARANRDLSAATGGDVSAITQVARLATWLRHQGVEVENLQKESVDALLASDLPPQARVALTARSEAGKASVSKLDSMQKVVTTDGRLHGLMQYHGATTGRWSGRLVQPHNFPRGDVSKVEWFIDVLLHSVDYDAMNVLHNPVDVISSLLRSMLVASPGQRLMAADFSAIEARVVAWLAGQDDLVEMFARGENVYKVTGESFGVGRQEGKAVILGAGFGMGGDKFLTMGEEQYGIDWDALPVPEGVDIRAGQNAAGDGCWWLTHDDRSWDFPSRAHALAHAFIKLYRARYPAIKQYWYDCEDMVLQAMYSPGAVFSVRNVRATFRGRHLWVQLPSGRFLCYHRPRIETRETPWGSQKDSVIVETQNSQTKRWIKRALYGGLLVENIVQATARDIMAAAMQRVEGHEYPVILTVHDEVVADVPRGGQSFEEFITLMQVVPEWANGLPVKASGWEGHRYRKG